jgi:hypothetical protein
MMTIERRRKLSAWLLLWVFVPMMALSVLHRHEGADVAGDNCYSCAHHMPHAGHLSGASTTMHQCVLCQFQSLPFLLPTFVPLVVFSLSFIMAVAAPAALVSVRSVGPLSLRGPPAWAFLRQ